MSESSREKWDSIYSTSDMESRQACQVLVENQHLLGGGGLALDLACGSGGNAVLLARRGFKVFAWDISPVAIKSLTDYLRQEKLDIVPEACDLEAVLPYTSGVDVVVVSRFLDRVLISKIKASLKPSGLIFYQTFIKDKPSERGPKNPDYLLEANELLSMFVDWQILFYREEARIGNLSSGHREEAMLVARRV